MIVWGKPELQKMVFASFALLILFGFVVVAVFAWCKPRNLVYGESGYRAETKLSFGTERAEITASEIGSLPGIEKPIELRAIEEPK